MNNKFKFDTGIIHSGARIKKVAKDPEALPLYLTTAFNVDDLDELAERQEARDYGYIRTRNPNRYALAELITYLEKGEDSIVCSSGMAAISTAILSITHANSHIIADKTLYGESTELLEVLEKFNIYVTFVNINNIDEVTAAFKDNTVAVYTETISNPMIDTFDIDTISKLAHEHNAKLIVDNTFATSYIMTPLTQGADIVVNSLTKFANGHSDVCIGAITSTSEIIKAAADFQALLGTIADPFDSWLCERGIRTMKLRLQKQSENALKLAEFLRTVPCVKNVYYIGLNDHPQHALAEKQFNNQSFGGMLSFELPEDHDLLNSFMRNLSFVHYAMTLGGYKTTISNPAHSSHANVPRAERIKLGITDGLIRVSIGIEDSDDLINEFKRALSVYK